MLEELLFAILEILVEVLLEAAFEFTVEFVGSLVLRSIEAMFDTSESKNPLLACLGYVFWGGSPGRSERVPVSARPRSSVPNPWPQSCS